MPLAAQQVYTAHDYGQAERWMSYNVTPLVDHTMKGATYLPDGRVFYEDQAAGATAYMLADPAKGTKAPAFDSVKLAAALSEIHKANKVTFKPNYLFASDYKVEPGGFAVEVRGTVYHCDEAVTKCHAEPTPPEPKAQPVKDQPANAGGAAKPAAKKPVGRRGKAPINVSPDKKLGVFIRDNNLWLRTIATGEEKQLTFDGVEDFGYGTDNAGWQHSDSTVATWSKDSKMLATFQLDQRKTGMMYLVPTSNRHPELEAWHYPLVGDKDVTMISPVVIDVASAKMVRIKTEPLEHRSMECDDVSCDGDGRWNDVEFSADDAHLAFVATSRDHKDEWVKVADTATGDVREVFHEHVDTYYGWQSKVDWKYMPELNEFLWVSERSNYAQIYLYDLATGKLKNQITHGDGPVVDIPYVDTKNRVVYFTATGKEAGVHPYFRMLYRVAFDGKGQTLLTPEKVDHSVTVAPDGKTFVDVASTVETPQASSVRDGITGKVLMPLMQQDISRLMAAGWKRPTPVMMKARDGKTELAGILWKPTSFDASRKYPVVDYIYPGPQGSSCNEDFSFHAARGDNQALADLGFVVLCIDGQGNNNRSKAFHDAHASKPEDMGDDTIPDQVAGIKDLAARFPFLDATRVGIWGHSGGGNATVSAMFHSPEFFKVGWAESGNHDNRMYEDDWDERWAGLEVIGRDGKSNYDAQANQNYAKNLQGKLMLVHGTMDDNVPPQNTLLVADALMKANKNFDMLMVPNAHHGYAAQSPYIMRRRWDYFVTNLGGGVAPTDFAPTSYPEMIKKMYGE